MQRTSQPQTFSCSVEATLSVMGGKWKTIIIWYLRDRTWRYNELQAWLKTVSPKMLTKQLRELEADGIVKRTVYPEIPPKVEYQLTERGMTLLPILREMKAWGYANMSDRLEKLDQLEDLDEDHRFS